MINTFGSLYNPMDCIQNLINESNSKKSVTASALLQQRLDSFL